MSDAANNGAGGAPDATLREHEVRELYAAIQEHLPIDKHHDDVRQARLRLAWKNLAPSLYTLASVPPVSTRDDALGEDRWYTRDELYHYLRRVNYAHEVADELAGWIADHLERAYRKGKDHGTGLTPVPNATRQEDALLTLCADVVTAWNAASADEGPTNEATWEQRFSVNFAKRMAPIVDRIVRHSATRQEDMLNERTDAVDEKALEAFVQRLRSNPENDFMLVRGTLLMRPEPEVRAALDALTRIEGRSESRNEREDGGHSNAQHFAMLGSVIDALHTMPPAVSETPHREPDAAWVAKYVTLLAEYVHWAACPIDSEVLLNRVTAREALDAHVLGRAPEATGASQGRRSWPEIKAGATPAALEAAAAKTRELASQSDEALREALTNAVGALRHLKPLTSMRVWLVADIDSVINAAERALTSSSTQTEAK